MQAEAERPWGLWYDQSPATSALKRFLFDRLLPTSAFIFTGVIILAPLHTNTHHVFPFLAPRAVLQFLSLPVPAAAVGATQVAVDINEPELSPRVKCRHLTHLGPAEGPQPREDWSFYKPPNEGLLAMWRRGQTWCVGPEHVLPGFRLPFKQYSRCYCNSYCCSCCGGYCCQVYWQSVHFDSKEGDQAKVEGQQ